MIRIVREREPVASARAREWRLARALIKWRKDEAKPTDFTGYDTGRQTIWNQQHHKCAYCEASYLRRSADIEHYRPKSIYWWLAWSWDNLFQICGTCNGSKLAAFPLAPGSSQLEVGQLPPRDEHPLIIDPAAEDPRRHIHFVQRPDPEHPGRTRWEPEGKTEAGSRTLIALEMHDDLLDNYRDFAEGLLDPNSPLAGIRLDIANGREPSETWRRYVYSLLRAPQPYRSLAYDILVWFREDIRATHSVELPPVPPLDPGPPTPPPIPLFAPDPTLDPWPELTQLYIRLARSGHATADERREALAHVLDRDPLATDALAALFGKAESTLNGWLRDLLPGRIHRQRRRGAPSLITLVTPR